MKENLEKVKLLACDLRNGKEFPHSPWETPDSKRLKHNDHDHVDFEVVCSTKR